MTDSSEITRQTFLLWRAGANLHSDDMARLAIAAGLRMTANRLRELGRDSHRALSITPTELEALMLAWRGEQRPDIAIHLPITGAPLSAFARTPMDETLHLRSAPGHQVREHAGADLYGRN